MNVLPTNQNLIIITDENKKEIRRIHEMDDEERLRDGVAALGEWCDKQHHFVETNINKNHLEKSLILSKGSVEEAKIKIDRVLTTRGMMADLLLKRTPEEMTRLSRVLTFTPLPKLNPMDQTRITTFKFLTENADDVNIVPLFRYVIMVVEYFYAYDYAVGARYMYDLKNVNLSMLAKLNPVVLKKFEVLTAGRFYLSMCNMTILHYEFPHSIDILWYNNRFRAIFFKLVSEHRPLTNKLTKPVITQWLSIVLHPEGEVG
ncbi:hypothetical protein EVAR_58941_1 [Eumeta japonica]|uniref:CRAL-TRIO domain-containing protein n=1 Tax=Eumeta variegata TaxID=151549 RepID=A0A4C1YK16_EUMVA|nr:hypothetical protein EVAR_58941_1 [Eumeta japonica]